MSDEFEERVTRRDVKRAVKEAIDELLGLGEARMAGRFEGGTLVLKPGKADTQEKTIPLGAFFHKITMVRDRLRVLEQRINSHPKLADEDRLQLHDYISRIYGSLTTFNVLFADPADRFVGTGGRDEG